MKKRLLAIALACCFAPIVLPQHSEAQVETAIGASACAASGACGVIVGIAFAAGVGYYVLQTRNGRRYNVQPNKMEIHRYPVPQAGPRPSLRGDMRVQGGDDLSNIPGVQEVHFVMSPQHCKNMYNRYKGEGLSSYRFIPNPQPGARKAGFCKLLGSGAITNRFHDRRYDSQY